MIPTALWLALAAPAPAADGASQYAIYCAGCHGAEGRGDGPAGGALTPRPANFTDPAFWAERDDARLATAITKGGPAVGRSPLMAGFEGRLDEAQVAAIVAYLRATFAPAPSAAPADAAPAPAEPAKP